MIQCDGLHNAFKENHIDFFTGVPDSTFKDWTKYLDDKNGKGLTNIIASNECEAVAITSGYHLGTGKTGVVYMQNSGLGKCVNPLTSLADKEVYAIPMLLLIGWRGEPGKKDEPQHKKMGRITMPLLDTLEIPYKEMPADLVDVFGTVKEAREHAEINKTQYALIIKKGIFEEYSEEKKKNLAQ